MRFENEISIERCPYCSVANPRMVLITHKTTGAHSKPASMVWACYKCGTCGGVTLASGSLTDSRMPLSNNIISSLIPEAASVDDSVPARAADPLREALQTLSAPRASIMVANSAIDAMLKEKGYLEGSLFRRIEQAVEQHLLTPEMAAWAHDVRLDSNDQRHADFDAEPPTTEDAKRVVEFARALAEFLFVLPSRVQRGHAAARRQGGNT